MSSAQSREGNLNGSVDFFFRVLHIQHTQTLTHTHTHTEIISRRVSEQKACGQDDSHAGNHDVMETYHSRYMALLKGRLERDRKITKKEDL